ncbi:hypothetical protein FD30_GL000308 [Levilactobacillus namurensis DSM 19117]|uniref:Uncharacterized protein n=1 Tax=Levilactobacillus namurensis DSM 19117 TaxID=1423773 RepID=A0A0R1JWV2_9LACO|nr:hypothetical protein [Levilactobacillus namurensis]KRK73731.1 hypothetical protein FD30_GL000308 [Levilactobacillus namurensis DSM 19117]GEO75415.1 hypothetical protein LNA02_21130 [Levilactobacillus namurensis]
MAKYFKTREEVLADIHDFSQNIDVKELLALLGVETIGGVEVTSEKQFSAPAVSSNRGLKAVHQKSISNFVVSVEDGDNDEQQSYLFAA